MRLQFGGPDNDLADMKDGRVVIVPVPYGKTITYKKGTMNGPRAILEASGNLELFDEELKQEVYKIGINTLPLLKVKNLKPEKMVQVVEGRVSEVLKQDKFPVVLGGEHTVTIGAVEAVKKKYKDISILYFDAHYDLRDRYRGSKYNHACVARRLLEIAPLVEVGVRSLSKEEFDILKQKNIRVISMQDLMKEKDWVNIVKDHLTDFVYISVDLDVFDSSIMSAVGTPEPGGMKWYKFLGAIRNITSSKRVVGFDVVELCPIKDMVDPDFMAAKLVYKILGYVFDKDLR